MESVDNGKNKSFKKKKIFPGVASLVLRWRKQEDKNYYRSASIPYI